MKYKMLRFLDAGESHGPSLSGIIEGFPAGVNINIEEINNDLRRRQGGYGRGKRMKIESDSIDILSGLINEKTIGSPISLVIKNKDWENWKDKKIRPQTIPRPGHVDYAGSIKYGFQDLRNTLERSSARNTAMRVAIGSFAKQLLREFNIKIFSYVTGIGSKSIKKYSDNNEQIESMIYDSPVYCPDKIASVEMCKEIEVAGEEGDTLGGVFEVFVPYVPPGLGSYVFWDRRLDSRLASSIMSIPGVKALEIGDGIKSAKKRGSAVHDEIFSEGNSKNNILQYYRKTNRAGGIEGGVTNGEPIVIKVYFKPIPTLLNPLNSIDFATKKEIRAGYQRSDICVVPAASIVGRSVAAWEIANAFLEKFSGDYLLEIKENYKNYKKRLQKL